MIALGETWGLERQPPGGDPSLRAWSTADVYILDHAQQRGLLERSPRVLIVNDAFGALGVPVSGLNPQWWSDSFRAARALRHNLTRNHRDRDAVTVVGGDTDPAGAVDLVLLRFPKTLAWLHDQLLRLRPLLTPDATVIAGGMIKHTPRRAFDLLESCIGPTSTSLGWKKARLALARLDPQLACDPGVSPRAIEVDGRRLSSRANVFSWDKLDQGARALLPHVPSEEGALTLIDQGCGNGILALTMAHRCPNATVLGVDESYQAVRSAIDNAARYHDTDRVRFVVNDDLADAMDARADLIVCNPPFHQTHTIGDQVAWGMFRQAHRALVTGGRYLVVGNRHLRYDEKLRRLFGNCQAVDAGPKFVVLSATKRR